MKDLDRLLREVETSRSSYIKVVSSLSPLQGIYKPDLKTWSAAEITEHLYHAEFGGISGMWKAVEGFKNSNPPWQGEHINKGLSIEEVVEKTWKQKEDVPPGAGPRLFGPLQFWIDALKSCSGILNHLTEELRSYDLQTIIYPHPISGPLDASQRYEFIRFHFDRHRIQVENLKQLPDFPERNKRVVMS